MLLNVSEKIDSKQKRYPNKDNSLELITLLWPSLSFCYMSIYELFSVSKWYIMIQILTLEFHIIMIYIILKSLYYKRQALYNNNKAFIWIVYSLFATNIWEKRIYNSLVKPQVEYAIISWENSKCEGMERLVTKQKQDIRNVTNAKINAHLDPLLGTLKI